MTRVEFTAFLNRAIAYIEKWFDFSEENWLFSMQPLYLQHETLKFDQMERVVEKLSLVTKLDMDELYDACTSGNTIIRRFRENMMN